MSVILIVDDEHTIRMMLSDFLENKYRIIGAENGLQALDILSQQHVDLVISDINMPGMNGEEFVRRLEQDELLRSIPVVVVSTDSTDCRMHQMRLLGAKGYVKKPFQPEALRDELERVLGVASA